MADRVVLHVGLMKSGTSYIQKRLQSAQPRLAEHGVLFPGPRWKHQVDAVIEVLEVRRRPAGDLEGAWQRLVEQIASYDGTAVVSMEFLGPARAPQIERIVDAFGDTPVEVVITARDLNRTLPAMWQEVVKNGGAIGWSDYLEAVHRDQGFGTRFWRQQRIAVIVRRWAERVGMDAVTLVTVPPPGAPTDLLWERWCEAVRIDPALAPPVAAVNESLGAASAMVLREVNERLAAYDIPWADYSRHVKFGLAKAVMAGRRSEEDAIGLKVPKWLKEAAASMRRNIEASGVRVVGSLDDLTPTAVRGVDPAKVRSEERLAAAVDALADVLRKAIEATSGAPLRPIDSSGADVVEEAGLGEIQPD